MTNSVDFQGDSNYDLYERYVELDGDLRGLASIFSSDFGVYAVAKGYEKQVGFMETIRETLNDLQSDFESATSELKAKISECDDPVLKQHLEGSLDELNDAWTMITHEPPGMKLEMKEFRSLWNERIANVRSALVDGSMASRATENLQAVDGGQVPVSGPGHLEKMQDFDSRRTQMVADAINRSSGASSSSGTSGAAGASAFGGKTVDEMSVMMSKDPDALMEHLDSLDPKNKQMAMQMIMQDLQDMNQMFSMMSNMMKSLHDTAKSAINNMRV